MFHDNKIHVTELEYHRNGVCGVGFIVAKFTFEGENRERESAIATVFNSPEDDGAFTGYCAVITLDVAGRPEIHMCWRGDHFEGDLRRFIESNEGRAMMWPNLYPNGVADVVAERNRLEAQS